MDLWDEAMAVLRPPLRVTMDFIEFDGPATLLEEDDLFLIDGYIGVVLSVDADTVLFEWRQSPDCTRNGVQERLSLEAEGRILFSQNSGHRRVSPETLTEGDCFILGVLMWFVCEPGKCRVVSPVGDTEFEAQTYPLPVDGAVLVLKAPLAEHLLRAQYQAVNLPPPEELFASLKKKGPEMNCPTLDTPLKDIQGFPRKLVKAVCDAYQGAVSVADVTFEHLMAISWNDLFVIPGCWAGVGGNSGSNALAVFLQKWGIEKQNMGEHFVMPGLPAEVSPETEAEAEAEAEAVSDEAEGIDGTVDVLEYIQSMYPDFDAIYTMQMISDGTGRKHTQLLELSGYSWEQLVEKCGETLSQHLYAVLLRDVGETLEFPFRPFLRQDVRNDGTPLLPETDTALPVKETEVEALPEMLDNRNSVADFLTCPLSEYFDFSGAVSKGFASAVTDFVGETFVGWTWEEVSACFADAESAVAFFSWVTENYALENAIQEEDGTPMFVWATPQEVEEETPEPEALTAELTAWIQAFDALTIEDRIAGLARLNENIPF